MEDPTLIKADLRLRALECVSKFSTGGLTVEDAARWADTVVLWALEGEWVPPADARDGEAA